MAAELTDAAYEFLLQRAGLDLSGAQKADLRGVYHHITAMAALVRRPRGHKAEPAHCFSLEEGAP